MPNQLNFADPIPSALNTRPARLSSRDTNLFQIGERPVWFGTSERDMVEVWVYDTNGNIVNHINIPATSKSLTLTTVVDSTGTYEYLNLDMGQYVRDMVLEQGRYTITVNFFRLEVGSPESPILYVEAISPDRTELRLRLLNEDYAGDLQEWAIPSVPKLEAKGLVDRSFGKLNVPGITNSLVEDTIRRIRPQTMEQVAYSETTELYQTLVTQVIQDVYPRILDRMALDVTNEAVQDVEFDNYIRQSVEDVLQQYKSANRIDARFDVY